MRIIQLPRPLSQCDEAPHIKMIDGDIILKYEDSESEEMISVCFETVYGFIYTETEYINTLDYVHGCVEIENSQWKELLLSAWELRDRNRNDAFGGESSKVSHYRMYFDEHGIYDVLCKEIIIKKL